MKKIYTILTILALTYAGILQAQVLQKSGTQRVMAGYNNSQIATTEATETQQWWGYMGNATNSSSVGVNAADTYHCAIYLPGNHDVVGGKLLCGVRFVLRAPHATNVKVWTASTLPESNPAASNTLWLTDVDMDEEQGDIIEVALPTPYAIPAEGIYVGYSFKITSASTSDDQYPIVTAGNDQPNALLVRTNSAVTRWSDLYGSNFGVLALSVLLEGTFPDYNMSPAAMQKTYYAQVNESTDINISLANNGQATANNVSYTITSNGVTGEEQTVTLDAPIATYATGSMTISLDGTQVASSTPMTLTITKVNGQPNESKNSSTKFTLNTLDRIIQRNVVVEEFTGTGCGWCPRGLVGMEKLRQTFGDRFVGIGIHQYNNTDAMYIADYPYLNFGGAPSCRINRGDVIDPYFGSSEDICNDFREEMHEPAMVAVDVQGFMNEALTEVDATAYIEPLFDTDEYKLELALVADGLSGTTSAWWQSNYYSSQPSSQNPEDLRIFCSGGKFGSSSVKGYVFNDVAVGTSYKNGANEIEALGDMTSGQTREINYTLTMPTKATLRNALKKGTVYVVALVVDADGRIANAAKRIVGEPAIDGVATIDNGLNTEATMRYSLDGIQLTAPQRGINIVRMSDGTVRKVFVK